MKWVKFVKDDKKTWPEKGDYVCSKPMGPICLLWSGEGWWLNTHYQYGFDDITHYTKITPPEA